MPDINVDNIGEPVVIHVPHVLDDHRSAEGTPAIPHQILEDAELFGRKLNRLPAACDTATDTVEDQVADLEPFGCRSAATEQHADARQQFDKREGLNQVIVRAKFQTLHPIVNRSPSAQYENRRARLPVANTLQDPQPVHIGKHHVQDDQVVVRRVDKLDGRFAIPRRINGVSRAFQPALQEVGNSLFVFNDKKAHDAPPL
jgi:hypothetical protein